jgi:hypothetical protein
LELFLQYNDSQGGTPILGVFIHHDSTHKVKEDEPMYVLSFLCFIMTYCTNKRAIAAFTQRQLSATGWSRMGGKWQPKP